MDLLIKEASLYNFGKLLGQLQYQQCQVELENN